MNLSQSPRVAATFDEVNLLPSAGLVPVMRLARRAGLESLVTRIVAVPRGVGANAAAKVASIVAGMVSGADSILDMDGLREGAVGKVLPGVKAPSTLGTFLRAFTFGHVRQLGAVAAGFLVALARLVPLLTGHDDHRDSATWLDVDDTMRELYGYAKQGVGYGYNKVKGLNALLGIVSAGSAPIIVGHRLRQGTVSSARGAGKFLADAIAAARRVGAGTVIRCRLDSAYYNHKVVAAIRHEGPILDHRPDGQGRAESHQCDSRGRLGVHQVPESDLRRGREAVDLRRAGRRNHLHRFHFQGPQTPGHRQVDRPAGETAQPEDRPAGAGRTVQCLPLPRGVHRFHRADADRRGPPP